MAGGTAVLGGLVLIPALVIMGVFSHLSANKKIKEIEEATAKALAAIGQYKELTLTLEAVDRRADEVSSSIRKALQTGRETAGAAESSELIRQALFSGNFWKPATDFHPTPVGVPRTPASKEPRRRSDCI
jgi:hypothetical protein